MTITNNDDQKSDPMDISEDDVVNEHQNTTTNGIEQTHLSNEGTVVVVMNGSSTFATHHDSPTNDMNKEAPVTCSSEHVQTEHVNDNSNSKIPTTENNDLPNKENHLSSLPATVLSKHSLDVPLTFSNIEKDDFVFQMIRGDGNCFYRAFAFSFLKVLGEREESFRVKIWNHFLQGVLTIMKNSFKLPSHLNSSLSEIRTRIFDFLVELFRIGEELPKSWNNVSEIIQLMNQPEFSDGMVLLLRYLTASHVFEKNHSLDMYFEFQSLDTGKSISTLIHDYVLKEVMPMGIEAEEIQINSLITVLKHLFNGCQVNFCFQLHIYHVSHSQERLTCLKYPPTHSTQLDAKESCDGAEDRFNTILSLLFRPGHYDSIVYSPSIRQTNDTQCK